MGEQGGRRLHPVTAPIGYYMSPVTSYSSSKISALYKPMYIHPHHIYFLGASPCALPTPPLFWALGASPCAPIKSRAFRKMAVVVRGGAKSGLFGGWYLLTPHWGEFQCEGVGGL